MSLTRTQRIDRISEALETAASLRLSDLAGALDVSEMTIRRDVAAHPERFVCHGGHVIAAQSGIQSAGYVFDREREAHAAGKRAACEIALGFIAAGDTVFIDCGTTTPHLARRLGSVGEITVVCYSINIAEVVRRLENVSLILLGGVYHRSSASFESPEGLEVLKRVGINKAFISAGGLHPTQGASCSNFHEVAIKQEAIRRSIETYLLIDSSKFGRVRAAYFADTGAFDAVLTDAAVDKGLRAEVEGSGPRVLIRQA